MTEKDNSSRSSMSVEDEELITKKLPTELSVVIERGKSF